MTLSHLAGLSNAYQRTTTVRKNNEHIQDISQQTQNI